MSSQYQALLFFKDSAEGKPVEVELKNDSLNFNYSGSDFHLPVKDTEFKLGGDKRSFLIANDNDVTLFIRDAKIFDELDKIDSVDFSQLKKSFHKAKHSSKITLTWLLSFFLIFLIICYMSFLGFVYAISKHFPISWEEKIGDIAITQSVKGKTVKDQSIVKAVENIGKYLDQNSNNHDYEMKFYVVRDKDINAFALPGGYIVVNTGLIEKSDSPEEVAGVLSHELQHIYRKHSIQRIVQRLGMTVIINLTFGNIGGLAGLGSELAGLKFDRGEESEADSLGLDLMAKSNIDPNEMVKFFEKLQENEKGLPKAVSFISTHPLTVDRIENLQSLIKSKYNKNYTKKFDLDWKSIKEKAAKE